MSHEAVCFAEEAVYYAEEAVESVQEAAGNYEEAPDVKDRFNAQCEVRKDGAECLKNIKNRLRCLTFRKNCLSLSVSKKFLKLKPKKDGKQQSAYCTVRGTCKAVAFSGL